MLHPDQYVVCLACSLMTHICAHRGSVRLERRLCGAGCVVGSEEHRGSVRHLQQFVVVPSAGVVLLPVNYPPCYKTIVAREDSQYDTTLFEDIHKKYGVCLPHDYGGLLGSFFCLSVAPLSLVDSDTKYGLKL